MYNLWRRPFETFLAALVAVVGASQAFSNFGYPPEMRDVVPTFGLRVYGLYVLVGSLVWLFALFNDRPLLERASLTALAGAFFLVVGTELYFVTLLDLPGIALHLTETVVGQMGLGIASVSRATYISSVLRKASNGQ